MTRIDLGQATDIAAAGLALTNLLARSAIGYQQWHALAQAANAAGRSDFTAEELEAIHAAMPASTDRFLSRDFAADPPP